MSSSPTTLDFSYSSAFDTSPEPPLSLNNSPDSKCNCTGPKCCCNGGHGLISTSHPVRHAAAGYGTIQSSSPSLRCHCHVVDKPSRVDKTARNKLLIACGIALLFTIGEATGLFSIVLLYALSVPLSSFFSPYPYNVSFLLHTPSHSSSLDSLFSSSRWLSCR